MTNESGKKPVAHKKHVARQQREQQQTRLILYIFFGILTAVIALLFYGWLDINYLQLNKPVAKVGENEILLRDFEPRVRLQRQQLLNQYNQYAQYAQVFGIDVQSTLDQIVTMLNTPTLVGQAVLDTLINEEVAKQEAAKRGITVSQEEIEAELEAAFDFYPNGSPTPTITPTTIAELEDPAEAFAIVSVTPPPTATLPAPTATEVPADATGEPVEATPESTSTPTTAPTIEEEPDPSTPTPLPTATPYTRDAFEQDFNKATERLVSYGFDENIYRAFVERQLLQNKLKEEITADVSNTETQVWARHILVADEQTAKDLIERLNNGEDFGALAAEISLDTSNAAQGGDLGWFSAGAMVPEFETAAFALENPGDITPEPVQTSFGYHIIQLVAKQGRPMTADQLRAAKDKAWTDWLEVAKEEYGVETFDIWQSRVPEEPNFITQATEAAGLQLTAQSESLTQTATARP